MASRTKNNKKLAGLELPAASYGNILFAYALAIFLSAALLFSVQPLFAKIVLPYLGGAPSVWSVALVFFQAALLAGYLYAHVLTRYLPGRQSVVVHVLVMLAATLALPLGIASGWGRPPAQGETFWLISLFTISIGLPFFALSANAPLLQAWFARTGHPSAGDPYFLYAASNIGSFLALLSYPLAIEPLTRLGQQARIWTWLFYLLIVCIAVCGFLLVRSRNAKPATRSYMGATSAPSWRDMAIWIGLAAVPSGLMIAVTAHISTDIAAAPLLWVIPLALYLLTFVIVFQRNPIIPHSFFVKAQPFFIALLIATFALDHGLRIYNVLLIHVLAFFVTAMVCHGELACRRPAAQHLTVFYLCMSIGGVIGGIFAGIIAPHVFNWIAEYPLLIVAAILCRPGLVLKDDKETQRFWLIASAALVVLAVPRFAFGYQFDHTAYGGVVILLLAIGYVFASDTLRYAAVIALIFMFVRVYDNEAAGRYSVRSFFGVHKILDSANGQFRVLLHGTTIHGAQRIRDTEGNPVTTRPLPITYYSEGSGISQALRAVRERKKGRPVRIAAIGLGTGSIACLTDPKDSLTYYEIDRTVVKYTRDDKVFTFLDQCKPDAQIVLGDARLTLANAPDGQYDIIIVDAFSSDAIPVHLLTKEAMEIYLKKLAKQGLVTIHISNRHLELTSVVAGISAANNALMRVNSGDTSFSNSDEAYQYSQTVTVTARSEADFMPLNKEVWEVQTPDPKQWVWTDDYSNIVGALIRNYRN